jgi:hypothetical protein
MMLPVHDRDVWRDGRLEQEIIAGFCYWCMRDHDLSPYFCLEKGKIRFVRIGSFGQTSKLAD